MNVEITQGYEKWKKLFLSVDAKRETYGIKVLAYGHAKDNENKILQNWFLLKNKKTETTQRLG